MATHVEHQHFDHLDRSKSPFAMDAVSTPSFPYIDAYGNIGDYLQFSGESPFSVGSIPRKSNTLRRHFVFAIVKKYFCNSTSVPNAGSPRLPFDSLNGLSDPYYSPGTSFTTGSPARPYTPSDNLSISPPTLTHLSNGELSSDGSTAVSTRKARSNSVNSTSSPGSVVGSLPTSRGQHRFNPIGSRPARPERKRRPSKDDYASDDDEEDFAPVTTAGNSDQRREEIRRQRIESEQRRRDELRDGYRRLKDVLPVSNQKSSKVSLLDRGE